MKKIITEILAKAGDQTPVKNFFSVSGGSISQAFKVETEKQIYFLKLNLTASPQLFISEAEGLHLLKSTDTLKVPEVYHYGTTNSLPGFILLEWVEGNKTNKTEEKLGRGLAQLHRHIGKGFGLQNDNYIGKLPQPNGWYDDWITFLQKKRLGFQAEMAVKNGYFSKKRQQKMDRLLSSLDKWIDHNNVQPSLLHGDLWGGNWIVGPEGSPYLIDPAVFYGDREFEIAFTQLFGGYSSVFYDAYQEASPLSYGYEERRPIYQLYYLLVHLNLFGESYGASVDRILARYGS